MHRTSGRGGLSGRSGESAQVADAVGLQVFFEILGFYRGMVEMERKRWIRIGRVQGSRARTKRAHLGARSGETRGGTWGNLSLRWRLSLKPTYILFTDKISVGLFVERLTAVAATTFFIL